MENICKWKKLLIGIMFFICFGFAAACTNSGGSSDTSSNMTNPGIEVAENTFEESTFNDTVFE